MHFEEEHQKVESLGNAITNLNIARKERKIAADAEYKAMRKAANQFCEERNKAVHNFVVLSNANAELTAEDRINAAKQTAEYGKTVFNLVSTYTRKQMYGAKNGD